MRTVHNKSYKTEKKRVTTKAFSSKYKKGFEILLQI